MLAHGPAGGYGAPIMLSNKSWRGVPSERLGGLVVGALVVGATLWLGLWAVTRARLGLQNHLLQTVAVPGAPVGPAAQAADGRMFVVTAEQQLVALERGGELAWNKRLAGPVTPVPLLVSANLLVLVGPGVVYGFSLGGEERFAVAADTALGDLASADAKGHLFLLDTRGGLLVLDSKGQKIARTNVGLKGNRRLVVLPSGQVMGVGTRDDGTHQMFWAEPSGMIEIRSLLPAAPVGVAVSAVAGEAGAVTAGREIWTLAANGPPEQIMRRLTLPGEALSAPLLPAEGGAYVLVQKDQGEALCHVDDQSQTTFCIPTAGERSAAAPWGNLPRQPTLGRNGLVFVPFATTPRIGPSFHGVLAVNARGVVYRQSLPGSDSAVVTALTWEGALLASGAGEHYLFRFDNGKPDVSDSYSVWPQALGSPAGASRPWQ